MNNPYIAPKRRQRGTWPAGQEWRDSAACLGQVELYELADADYNSRYYNLASAIRDAKKVCASCTVRQACLEDAMDNERAGHADRYSVRAGLTPAEREELSRERMGEGT